MTISGQFHSVLIESITVNREGRQRRDLGDVSDLAASLSEVGLINPIVITREGLLVAGERRLTAAQSAGWSHITAQYVDELSADELSLIELEENIKRQSLSWDEECRAMLQFQRHKLASDPSLTIPDIAKTLSMSEAGLNDHLKVARAIEDGKLNVSDFERYSAAKNFIIRQNERAQVSVLDAVSSPEKIVELIQGPTAFDEDAPLPRRATIFNQDFFTWKPTAKFNFIHCDFPYGVNAQEHDMGASNVMGGYADTPEIYFKMLADFCTGYHAYTMESAHLMFWFSMDYYQTTMDTLTSAGWKVNPFPLVWFKSDNTGIMPDPQRGPRRIYETAFLCYRGDRKVVRPVANAYAAPTTKNFHMSEKSLPMLQHFFRMFVDESTQMLDPTCGSGNAVKASEIAGAAFSIGFELDPAFALGAKTNLGL